LCQQPFIHTNTLSTFPFPCGIETIPIPAADNTFRNERQLAQCDRANGIALRSHLFLYDSDHFMRYQIREQHDQIRTPHEALQMSLWLRINLRLTAMFPANIPISAHHSVISPNNHNIHNLSSRQIKNAIVYL
jgi:hypothetical protein